MKELIKNIKNRMKTVYICNACGKEHEYRTDAVNCHPDIIEQVREFIAYKSKSGKWIENEKQKLEENQNE